MRTYGMRRDCFFANVHYLPADGRELFNLDGSISHSHFYDARPTPS